MQLLGEKKLDAVDFKVNIFREALADLFYLSFSVLFTGSNQLIGWQSGDKEKDKKWILIILAIAFYSTNHTNDFFFH